ncbi:hypothetical protein DOZ91_01675 [Peribacillus frigoritolerans]|nr:hypothetical protein DOZ91_01675 [Peribacillus frigoritolerans]
MFLRACYINQYFSTMKKIIRRKIKYIIDTLLKKIQDAEAIVVGGAAVISEAAGYSYYHTE